MESIINFINGLLFFLVTFWWVWIPVTLYLLILIAIRKHQAKRKTRYEMDLAEYQAKQTAIELYKLQQQDKLDPEIEELIKSIDKE